MAVLCVIRQPSFNRNAPAEAGLAVPVSQTVRPVPLALVGSSCPVGTPCWLTGWGDIRQDGGRGTRGGGGRGSPEVEQAACRGDGSLVASLGIPVPERLVLHTTHLTDHLGQASASPCGAGLTPEGRHSCTPHPRAPPPSLMPSLLQWPCQSPTGFRRWMCTLSACRAAAGSPAWSPSPRRCWMLATARARGLLQAQTPIGIPALVLHWAWGATGPLRACFLLSTVR